METNNKEAPFRLFPPARAVCPQHGIVLATIRRLVGVPSVGYVCPTCAAVLGYPHGPGLGTNGDSVPVQLPLSVWHDDIVRTVAVALVMTGEWHIQVGTTIAVGFRYAAWHPPLDWWLAYKNPVPALHESVVEGRAEYICSLRLPAQKLDLMRGQADEWGLELEEALRVFMAAAYTATEWSFRGPGIPAEESSWGGEEGGAV